MSIQIQRISDRPGGDRATTICDVCNYVIASRPAQPGEHVGTTLAVHNVCEKCSKGQPAGTWSPPSTVITGPSIGNPNAVSRIEIKE